MVDWERRATIVATILFEGLEMKENFALEFRSPKAQDCNAGIPEKLSHHKLKLQDSNGWQQMLTVNPSANQQLDIDDWLFIFARPDSTQARTDVI